MAYEIGGMITAQDDISALFGNGSEIEESNQEEKPEVETPEEEDTKEEVTEVSPEDLFGGPERVGNEDDDTEGEEREPKHKGAGSSPDNLYSSIANSLAEDGALSNLSDDELNAVKDSETLVAAMKKQVESMLDDTQKRINDALNAGMEVSQVQQYENLIGYLDSITEEQLAAENEQGEDLRKRLIYQYQINLGLSEDKAGKMVERAFSGGTDIEDAKEYLEALKEKYNTDYKQLIEEGKKQAQLAKKQQEENLKKMKDTLLKDEKLLGDIEIDAKTRQQAYDNWIKPTHKTEQGVYQSAIQKYIAENPMDFQMKVALLFTMTDGFTKMGNVLKQTVKKEKRKAIKELEHVVNNTQRTPSGTIDFMGKGVEMRQIAPIGSW